MKKKKMMMTTTATKTVKQEDDYVPYPIRYCTYAVPMERQQLQHQPREEEGAFVLLSFVWVPSNDPLFIAPDIQY